MPLTTPERYQQIKQLLMAVLELPADQRDGFLATQTVDDSELREEVDELLAGESNQVFLTAPAPQEASGPGMPGRIGPYRLLGKLGEGGMGVVYEARQDQPVERLVALKVVHFPGHQGHRDRFLNECQALARLNHPNVATLFDAGIAEGGHPYAAMELVRGEQICRYCDERNLTLRQRVQLFLQVCAGVSHAHQKNLLHLDLKPSNVLVAEKNGQAIAKVIDFGIARAIDDADPAFIKTRGRLAGSPAYMSPERISAGSNEPADTRTDVYGLTVLLHELLLGVRPFADENLSLAQLIGVVCATDAPLPSRRFGSLDDPRKAAIAATRSATSSEMARAFKGDLDAILTRGLARRPDHRYDSPGELAADLGRYIKNQPIKARPASTGYVLGRFLRRHWVVTALVTLVVFSLLTGLVTTTLQATRANREAERAVGALAQAEEVSDFLTNLFTQADPYRTEVDERSVAELLDDASRRVDEAFSDQPLTKARLMRVLGGIQERRGRLAEAERLLVGARDLLGSEGRDEELFVVLDRLSVVYRRQNRHAEALEAASLSLAAAAQMEHVDGLTMAGLLNTRANAEIEAGRVDDALKSYEEVHELRALALGDSHIDTAMALNNIATTYFRLGQIEAASAHFERVFEIIDGPLPQGHPWRSTVLLNLGVVAQRTGRLAPALRWYEQAFDEQKVRLDANHPDVQTTTQYMAAVAADLGDLTRARELSDQVVESNLANFGSDHPKLAQALRRSGYIDVISGDYSLAEQKFRQSHQILLTAQGPDRRTTWLSALAVAESMILQQRWQEARDTIQPILERAEHANPIDHATTLTGQRLLAEVELALGDPSAARDRMNQVVANHHTDASHARVAYDYLTQGKATLALGDPGGALGMFEKTLDRHQRARGARSRTAAEAWYWIGEAQAHLGQIAAAVSSLEKSASIFAEMLPPGHDLTQRSEARLRELDAS